MDNRTKRKCGLLVLCIFFMVQQGQTQVWKKLTEKLEKSNQTEKPQGASENSETKSGMGGFDLAGMMGQTKDFEAPAEYSFDFQITMEMNMEKGKPMTQVWKYNVAESYFGMEMSDMLIIYDLDSDVMVTLNPKDRTYTAMSTSMMSMFGSSDDEKEQQVPEMVKTNETKNILGYATTRYIMEDETMKGEFWMAPDVKFDQAAFAKSMGSYSKNNVTLPEKMQGFMMEMSSFDKKGKLTSHMKVVQLGEIDEQLDMSQYKNGMAF